MRLLFAVLLLGMLAAPAAQAATITGSEILEIPSGQTGSGNGTLDLRLFTFSGSEIGNASGGSDFDNGNNTLPQGGGADTNFFDESYITTAGELQAYFDLNFPGATGIQLVLFLDLNETGNGQPNNTLVLLDIVRNPVSVQGSPNPFGDVTSDEQAAIDQVSTGGSTIANLDPAPAANLPVNSQGDINFTGFPGINFFDPANG